MKKANILPIVLAILAVAAIIFGVVTNGQKADLQKQVDELTANVTSLTSSLDAAKKEAADAVKNAEDEIAKIKEEAEKAIEEATKAAEEAAKAAEEAAKEEAAKAAEEAAKAAEEAAKAAEEAAKTEQSEETKPEAGAPANGRTAIAKEDLKVGFIVLHDENIGYDYAHLLGIETAKNTLGLSDDQIIIEYNIPEDEQCYDAAVKLANKGCQIIFADSFGHEGFLLQAAEEFPEVEFCHATGYQAALSGLNNIHNHFTAVYESRYVSGVVAGLKLAEVYGADTDAKLGYVGAYSYAEVKSGFTAFFLGVRSICPNVTMEVKYTGSWADQATERETALALIEDGCLLIAQHADTTGAASACNDKNTLHVGYNVGMIDTAPTVELTSASIKWAPYYTYAIECMLNGVAIDTDWAASHADGGVWITDLNADVIAAGTEEKVAEVWAAIDDGSLKVFDTATWTVNGEKVTSTVALDGFNGLEYILTDGDTSYFAESTLASAPAFAFTIDGITELNQIF